MAARLTADLLVLLHAAFIGFVVLGGFLALRWPWLVRLHVPCAVWGAVVEFTGWICPLTPLENRLRRAAGGEGYDEGFIGHYVVPLVYPDELTPAMQVGLGIGVVVVNVVAYALLWRNRRRTA